MTAFHITVGGAAARIVFALWARGYRPPRWARRSRTTRAATARKTTGATGCVTIAGAVLLSVVTRARRLVRLRGREMVDRLPRLPRRGDDAARESEPRRKRGDGPPKLRLVDVRGVVRRLRRRQSSCHAHRRASLPSGVPGRIRRLACDEPSSRTPTLPPARPMCPNTGSRASRSCVHSTSKQRPPSARASESGANADEYVQLTIVLASILFLVGISTQFAMRGVRYGLIALATVLLVLSLIQVAILPKPDL